MGIHSVVRCGHHAIPDEPVVIPLGLMKYSPAKFFLAFFLGKLSITIIGAWLGIMSKDFLSSSIGQGALIIISIILTITVTVILLKIDLGKIVEKILKRKLQKWKTDSNMSPTLKPPESSKNELVFYAPS